MPMPVTRDRRYVASCAQVDRNNVKVGKAMNIAFEVVVAEALLALKAHGVPHEALVQTEE